MTRRALRGKQGSNERAIRSVPDSRASGPKETEVSQIHHMELIQSQFVVVPEKPLKLQKQFLW